MACYRTDPKTTFDRALRNIVGDNVLLHDNIFTNVVFNGEFTDGFKEYYKKVHPSFEGELDIDGSNANEIALTAKQYYFKDKGDSRVGIRRVNTSVQNNYATPNGRQLGVIHAAEIGRFILNQASKRSRNLSVSRKVLENKIISTFKNKIVGRISQIKKISKEEANALIESENKKFDNLYQTMLNLIGEENLTISDRNVLAAYRDMTDNTVNETTGNFHSKEYFDEVFKNPKLQSFEETKEQKEEKQENKVANANEIANGSTESLDSSDEAHLDETYKNYETHDGQYASHMEHFDGPIREYFDGLLVLNSDNLDDYDKSNEFGLPVGMDSALCVAVFKTRGRFTSLEDMIASAREIADLEPGFKAFHQFAADMEADKDFANLIWSTFSKYVISKVQGIVNDDTFSFKVSNERADKLTTIRFEFLNDIRGTVPRVNMAMSRNDLRSIANNIRLLANKAKLPSFNTNTEDYKNDRAAVVKKIGDLVRTLLPTISDRSLENYIKYTKSFNGSVNEINNIRKLYSLVENLFNTADTTQKAFKERISEFYKIKRTNALLDEAFYFGENVDRSSRVDPKSVFAKDFIDNEQIAASNAFAEALSPYMSTSISLTSPNAKRNQSSDVINSSMLTGLMNIINSELNATQGVDSPLQKWGKYKFKTSQYDLSNILIEHRDERGNIVNYGLFIKKGDSYIPTSYATRLLSIALFNGTVNQDDDVAAMYSEMSSGDYLATAMDSFFASKADDGIVKTAKYFMRTPSDAPKNYVFTAPVYSVTEYGGLFVDANSEQTQAVIDGIIDNIKVAEGLTSSNVMLIQNINDVAKHLTGNFEGGITINNNRTRPVKTDNGKYRLELQLNGTPSFNYVVEGTLKNKNGKAVLEDVKLVGVVQPNRLIRDLVTIPDAIKNEIENVVRTKLDEEGKIEYDINENHPIFKQVYNSIIQELDDAAQAIEVIFEKDDNNHEIIKFVDGKPVYNSNLDPNDRTGKLFKNYHYNGSIVEEVGEGLGKKLRLTGNVFKSDKLTMVVDGKSINFMEGIITDEIAESEDGSINLLYGGARNGLRVVNGKAVLSEAQKNRIRQAVKDFINGYVNESLARTEKFADFAHTEITKNNVAEFVLNYRLAFTAANDLFEGNPKFYKNVQDFLKRAKEVQGSGVPYASVGWNYDFGTAPTELSSTISELNTDKIQTKLASLGLNIKAKTGFVGVTIANTVRTNKAMLDALIDDLVTNGNVPRERAEDMILGHRDSKGKRKGGFPNITTNDAQSYITFEEFIRRIAAKGQLYRYMPLIERIMDETQPLDAATLKEFVQVQKNFYYDQYYDEDTKTMAPRQIKNAEFVLIPRLIKGTELEQVYNLMHDNGIDQLNTAETSKAGKQKVLTLFDNEGNISSDAIKNFSEHAVEYSQSYDYRFLYTQQETPQHAASMNKAGIQIVKKMFDNLPLTGELAKLKERFNNLMSQNIEDSFLDLMDELGVERDADGNIMFDAATNKIVGLNYQIFFEKMEKELLRLVSDSNSREYVTLDTTAPEDRGVMPFFMSGRSKKFEQIVQSIFNSGVTRQKLPGFHAAQITAIGWKAYNESLDAPLQRELRYHPTTDENGKPLPKEEQRVVEVLVPKSFFKFKRTNAKGVAKTDKELLDELKEAELDEVIGYRIPTEGKQSVAVLKIVGFVDDAYGSTIVVPDGWVAQTGSDFDIDSVYGIQHNTFIDRKGHIRKVKFKETSNESDYIKYINHQLERSNNTKFGKQIKAAKSKIDNQLKAEFNDKLKADSDNYKKLPQAAKDIVQKVTKEEKRDGSKNKRKNLIDRYKGIVSQLSKDLRTNLANYSEKDIEAIDAYISTATDFVDYLENQGDRIYTLKERAYQEASAKTLELVEKEAVAVGLPSFEDYKKLDYAKRNDKRARDTQICDDMITILKSDECLEENLSQSQFGHIIDTRDELQENNPAVATERKNRSPYDIFDQAAYQEDAMSGAHLKGVSVSMDTLCSVCNTVRPTITESRNAIKIKYDKKNHSLEELRKSFDQVEEVADGYIVTHNTYGWSKNNRNVDGSLLTVYSSETTAHILDAIKEGAIPNVNDYTFGVYKNFVNMGSNYRMAIAFMMQPAITRIVQNYNKTNSIYSDDNSNPINASIIQLATILARKNGDRLSKYPTLQEVAEVINKSGLIHKVSAILGVKAKKFDDLINSEDAYTFDVERLVKRLSNSSPVEENEDVLAFDLAMTIAYKRLNDFASQITATALVSNPDRFGAKQTIFATQKIFDDIASLVDDKRVPLSVGDTDFLSAIYPSVTSDINKYNEAEKKKSAYPTLEMYFRRATASSIIVNRVLFKTHSPQFEAVVKEFYKYKSGNFGITEQEYESIVKHIIGELYSKTQFISARQEIVYDKSDKLQANAESFGPREIRRIFGYNVPLVHTITVEESDENGKPVKVQKEFEISDVNKPTQEELNEFVKLSPAQKVVFIQQHFEDSLVCKYLKARTFNTVATGVAGRQVIDYKEDVYDLDSVHEDFLNMYYNTNPLLQLTAVDLIKYAVVAEGFSMKRNGITPVIANEPLRTLKQNYGTGFVEEMYGQFDELEHNYGAQSKEALINTYARSNSNSSFVGHVNARGDVASILSPGKHGVIFVSENTNRSLLAKAKIITFKGGDEKLNGFVTIKRGKGNPILYKITRNYDGYYLYPLNKLEENEHGTWSANPSNNMFPSEAFYESYINQTVDRKYSAEEQQDKLPAELALESDVTGEYKYDSSEDILYSSAGEQLFGKSEVEIRGNAKVEGNETSRRTVHTLENIDGKTAITSDEAFVLSAQAVATNVKLRVESLLNGPSSINNFIKIGDRYVSIDNPEVFNRIKTDAVLRRKWLKTILDARALIYHYNPYLAFDYTDENPEVREATSKIRNAVKKLTDNEILARSEELLVKNYLDKVSDNPTVRANLVSVMDGYHSSGAVETAINDLQDTGNPIVQLILKEALSDISAKSLQGKTDALNFTKHVEDLKKRAAANGRGIDWDKVVDKDARLIRDYTEDFITEYHRLTDELNKAYNEAPGSIAHLKAKLARDKFMLANMQQEVVDDYYRAKIALDEKMLSNPFSAEMLSEYKTLTYQLRSVIDRLRDNYSEEDEKLADNLRKQIDTLTAPYYFDASGEINPKEEFPYGYSSDPEVRKGQLKRSLVEANRLKKYIVDSATLDNTYFEYQGDDSFIDTLDRNKAIVSEMEEKRKLGLITEDELANNQKYIDAKRWIKEHAYFEYKANTYGSDNEEVKRCAKELEKANPDLSEYDFDVQVAAARSVLRKRIGSPFSKKSIYKVLLKEREAFDEFGIPDARKLTREDIKKIKEEQERRMTNTEHGTGGAYNERNLLRTALVNGEIFNEKWYSNLNSSGLDNVEYLETVKKFNDIVRHAYNAEHKVLNTSALTDTEINEALKCLEKLGFDISDQTINGKKGLKRKDGNNGKIYKFIKDNATYEYNMDAFNAEERIAKGKGSKYYNLWHTLNYEWVESEGQYKPNHLIWGQLVPKDSVKAKYLDYKAMNARRIMSVAYKKTPSKYYYEALYAKQKEGAAAFNEWYEENHIWDGSTGTMVPLDCWVTYEPTEALDGEWKPRSKYTDRIVKEDARNENWNGKYGPMVNYKRGGQYDNPIQLNEEETELRDYLQNILNNACSGHHNKKYAIRGDMPKVAKSRGWTAENVVRETLGTLGVPDIRTVNDTFDKNVGYEFDSPVDTPLMSLLHSKDIQEEPKKPKREDYDNDEDYNKKLVEYEQQKKDVDEHNRKVRQELQNRDWESIMPRFIEMCARQNAIQDNKYLFYFGLKLIEKTPVYSEKYRGIKDYLIRNGRNADGEVDYAKEMDVNLRDHYINYIRRLLLDQWKENPNSALARIAKVLQSFTSTKYMAMNIRGGIANVTLGQSQILGEAFAKEYFGHADWAKAHAIWGSGVLDYMAHVFNDDGSDTLPGAIIKRFDVIDYDEIAGFGKASGLVEINNRVRKVMFSPQTAGEHYMQNSAMFAMMLSHRVVEGTADGTPSRIMNESEYVRDKLLNDLSSILNDDQVASFNKFVSDIKKDKNVLKEYARFRKDALTEWMISTLNREQQKEFNKIRKEKTNQYKEEFKKHPDVYSQFKLGEDGQLEFADGSLLGAMNTKKSNGEISDASKVLGEFRERVISVNKKIHGVYDKMGSAQIEKTWWGSALMQYHKHLVPQWLKRYRRQGTFNEIRGTVEKGSYISIIDFLSLNARAVAKENGATKEQLTAFEAAQTTIANTFSYFGRMLLTYQSLPEYERANLRRNLGDICGAAAAVILAFVIAAGGDDDDDGIMYNLALYEADRLASEAMMYNPFGAAAEFKKFWSSPVALMTAVSDVYGITGETFKFLIQGEDYDGVYTSGKYAGRKKIDVLLSRNIPIWRNIDSIIDIANNNKYYKMGTNILGVINAKGSDE